MKKSFRLIAVALGLLVSSVAFTACDDDDDDNNTNPSQNTPVSIELKGSYNVNADLMNIKWVDTVYFNKVNDTLVNMTLSAANMPQDSYRIANASFKNITLSKSDKGYVLSNNSENFEASLGMGARAGADIVEYSTKNANALLTINSFNGLANSDTLNVSITLQAGKMPLTIPLTLVSSSVK